MTPLQNRLSSCFTALIFVALQAGAYQPITPPVWADDPDTVELLYLFPDDNQTLTADRATVPFGAPSASVALGLINDGWQDPVNPISSSGGDADNGAWDLGAGPEGAIHMTLVLGDQAGGSSFESYNVKIKINAVCYQLMTQLPSLALQEYQLSNLVTTDSDAFSDPSMGTWKNRTWTAEIADVRDNSITLSIVAHAWGSLIDAVEVYALATVQNVPTTAKGTPISWFARFNLAPQAGTDWDDLDLLDSDGDGVANWQEYIGGTDPTDATSYLHITNIEVSPYNIILLQWIGGTNGPASPYLIEGLADMNSPLRLWSTIGQVPRTSGTNTWQIQQLPSAPLRLFRIRALP